MEQRTIKEIGSHLRMLKTMFDDEEIAYLKKLKEILPASVYKLTDGIYVDIDSPYEIYLVIQTTKAYEKDMEKILEDYDPVIVLEEYGADFYISIEKIGDNK